MKIFLQEAGIVEAPNEYESINIIKKKYPNCCINQVEKEKNFKFIYYYYAKIENKGISYEEDGILKREFPINNVKQLVLVKDAVFKNMKKVMPQIHDNLREELKFITLSLMV